MAQMSSELYQKIGIAVDKLAQDLLSRIVGDRIPPISEYQERLQVSRGTIQNALNYLTENNAVQLSRRGHLGTFIEAMDYRKLQECCMNKELLGIMPLPYSQGYQGLATALFRELGDYSFNLIYSRGAESRLKLVASGVCQFAVCSRYAAEEAIQKHKQVQIALDLGPGTYLTQHVLVFREPGKTAIEDGMRVAYDRASADHRNLTQMVTEGRKNVKLVDMKAHQTVKAIQSGEIDAGVWNLDEILESGYVDLNVTPLPENQQTAMYSSAVLVVAENNEEMIQLLRQNVCPQNVSQIQQAVREGRIEVDF